MAHSGHKGSTQFFDIKSTILMKSEDVAFNVDEVLKNVKHDISQEFDMFLTKLDEKDQKIILNVYHLIMQKILQEQDLINKVKQKYLESCEFRNLIVKWLDVTPNIDDLLLIKKRMKNIKAQLRWKLVEKHNLEESDNYSKSQMVKIKEEISALQDNMFQEIHNEQEEYEKLSHLVQKVFPELLHLHQDAEILKYMNSGSLIVHLERNLLNAEPMKELSIKHPVMCSTIQEQKVLLKGYIADTNIETKIIERASKYHQVWKELKEESCLMQPMFLFLCKSDPIMYLMIPYYAGANLGTLQMTAPLIVQLFIGKQEIKTNTDGTPQIDGLAMDDKVKSLLSQLLCYDNRMTAEQVLNADCFFSPDPISVPPESEGTEYDHGEQTSEIDMSDEGLDDETDTSVD